MSLENITQKLVVSAGEDNLFIIISALVSMRYYYDSITSNNDVESVLLIDEFDATLHPSLQFKLLDIFREYSACYKIQIVFTTHSLSTIEYALKKKDNVIYLIDNVDLPTGRLEELSASDIDILALNERTKLEQKYFSNFLKDHSHGFVCTWTEPTMCRGMTSRVGYRGVPSGFDEANAFIQSCKNYFESVHAMNDEELLSILVNDLVSRLGYKGGLPLKLECGSVSTVSPDTQFVSAALLQNPYLGKNYAFFQLPMPSGTVKTISAVASDAHIFQMLCQEFEYLDGADYYLLDGHGPF